MGGVELLISDCGLQIADLQKGREARDQPEADRLRDGKWGQEDKETRGISFR